MQYITTTDLRTKTPKLINTLKQKGEVSLIHRSKIIGIIKPIENPPKLFDVEKFRLFLKSIKPIKIVPRSQRDKIYRKHLMEKYGKRLH